MLGVADWIAFSKGSLLEKRLWKISTSRVCQTSVDVLTVKRKHNWNMMPVA